MFDIADQTAGPNRLVFKGNPWPMGTPGVTYTKKCLKFLF